MSDRSVSVLLKIDVAQYVGNLTKAESATKGLAKAAEQASRDLTKTAGVQDRASGKAATAAESSAARQGKASGSAAKAAEAAASRQEKSSERAADAAEDAADRQEKAAEAAASAVEGAAQDGVAATEESAAAQIAAAENIGQALLITGGVIASGVLLAVNAFADFDAAMSQAQAGSNASGKALDDLRASAIKAGAETQYSAVEAANAITEMSKAGVSTRDILGGGLSGALSLAAAGQLDVASASEIAATSMNQFGLEGKDIPHIADLLAAGAGKAMGSVQDLAGALKYVGPTAKGLEISIEQTTGALAMFAQQGLLGEQAGTSLRSVMLTLTSPSGVVAKRMEEMGINVYDAQGKFIGLDGAAGQLREKLGPLDDATRNAALGQIFGNEAVGAARILYEGGAAAVQDWTKKVDDSGFAARQAATLTDNLKGDVERLGGSLSSVMITSGSATNGVLREMTKQLQGALDLYGSMPVPVQQGALAIAAVTAAASMAAGAMLLMAPRIVATKAALLLMGPAGAAAARGIALAGAALRMMGGPLLVAVGVLGVFANQARESKGRVDEMATSLDQQTGAVTANTTAWINKNLSDSGVLEQARTMGVLTGDSTLAVEGNTAALGRIKVATDAYKAAGAANGDQVSVNTDEVTKYMAAIGGGNDELNRGIAQTKLLAETNKAGAAATAATGSAAAGARGKAKALTISEEDLEKAAAKLKKTHDALKDAITGFGSAMLGARGDARSYEAAIDAAAAAVKENGRTLNIGTEKGRANQAALDGISTAALKAAESTLTAAEANGTLTGATKTVGANVTSARKAFINAAVSMGMTKAAAGVLATQSGLTAARVQGITNKLIALGGQKPKPKVDVEKAAAEAKIKTLQAQINSIRQGKTPGVKANTAEGKAKIAALQKQIDNLRGKAVKVTATVAGGDQVSALKRYMDGLRDKKVTLTVAQVGGLNKRAAVLAAQADGGPIVGRGGPREDNILIAASSGEYMINARSTAKHRPLVEAINADRFADGGPIGGRIQHLATGGFVSANFSDLGSRMPSSVPTGGDITEAKARETAAITAVTAAETHLYKLRKTKGHTAAQISKDENVLAITRRVSAAATRALRGAEAARYAGTRPLVTQFHKSAVVSNAGVTRFLRNIATLRRKGFGVLADQLVMQGDAEAYTLAEGAVLNAGTAKALTSDVNASVKNQSALAAARAVVEAKYAPKVPAQPTWALPAGVAASTYGARPAPGRVQQIVVKIGDKELTSLVSATVDGHTQQLVDGLVYA